ncbi:MAG: hypothetical protein ACXWQO_13750 [Bdellovibrionota bacterium]
MKNLKLITLTLGLLASFGQLALAQCYNPEALALVLKNVKQVKAEGKQPIVMFDLDDTLINTRERTFRIIKDYLKQASVKADISQADLKKLNAITASDIHFLMADTLKSQGIVNANLEKNLGDFWAARFFTNEYAANDKQNPGAARYTREISRAGAKVVYLTGRDAPRMQEGTMESLRKGGFPVNPVNALLMLKPDKSIPDLDFKKDSFAKVAALGEMVGVFENEPANINAMADAFPASTAVLLDTIHSPTNVTPELSVSLVKDFFLETRQEVIYQNSEQDEMATCTAAD